MPAVNFELLRDKRDELDLSNEDLAAKLNLSYGYVANILGGRDKPSRRVIRRFERVLGLAEGTAESQGQRQPKGDPSEPPVQPKNEPTAPPKREESAGTGPARIDDRVAS